MRHSQKRHKLGRESSQRLHLLAQLSKSLAESNSLYTTVSKAKALRPVFEKLITICKNNDNFNAYRFLAKRGISEKFAKEIIAVSSKFENRNGGYTRVVKAGSRLGDNAPMAFIELVL